MSVIRKEAYFSSSDNVHKVRTLIWCDDKISPIGVVQISHGVCEHIGRYDDFARMLAENGFVVCGNDHLGHGKTVSDMSELGYVYDSAHVNMVRDMNTLHKIMAKRYAGLPYFMFGHSMGSFLARIYAAAFNSSLAGAVFCGTGQVPAPVLMLEDPVDYIMDKLPENSTAPAAVFGIFERFTKRVLRDSDNLAWLSRNAENIENYRNDPLSGFPITRSLMKELVSLAVKASLPDWGAKIPADFPVLFVSGAKDPVGMFGRGVLAAADELAKVGNDPEVILYPADRHEILNEEDREKVYGDILKFLKDTANGACDNG